MAKKIKKQDNSEFFIALNELIKERKIDKSVFVESMEAGLASAYKKESGEARNIIVKLDDIDMTIKVFAYQTVVEEVEDFEKEISLEDARAIMSDYNVGDMIFEEVSLEKFSRVAAQTAKQVIMQRLNDVQKNRVIEEMNDKEGELLTATVRRVENDNVYLELPSTQLEGIMAQADQIAGESYKIGDIVKVYVKGTRQQGKGTQVVVSRANIGFVKRLFENEVPEMKTGLVIVKKIVREAGYRTKLAVYSEDENIDAAGACIGNRGMRINAIVQQLNGEKIDIVQWSNDPMEFIANSLSPAKVLAVEVNPEKKTAIAIVPDEKLSLAIGKSGQNVRLAAKLTDWKIDVKPMSSDVAKDMLSQEEENEQN